MDKMDLKSCPFCGEEAVLRSRETNYFSTRYFVMCEQCHAESKNCQHKEDAVYAWNERAEQTDHHQVKHGHWVKKHRHRSGYRQVTGKTKVFGEILTITIDERYEIDDLYCSECGKLNESVFTNFCPNCGADMRGELNG